MISAGLRILLYLKKKNIYPFRDHTPNIRFMNKHMITKVNKE